MNQSLSVVLPVHNAEATLARQVNHLLEFLPDLTSKFEVLIVDDGSTDHTEESAHDLAREFPQLRVLRHAERRGISAGAQTGIDHATGQYVYVQGEDTSADATNLQRLWQSRSAAQMDDLPALPGRLANLDGSLIGRLIAWGSELKKKPKQAALAGLAPLARRKAVSR